MEVLPADSHNDASPGLVAGAAGVPHVVPHTGPGQEVQRARRVVHSSVGVVREAGDVLLQYEAVPGAGGAGAGRGGRHSALGALGSAALGTLQAVTSLT